METTVICGDLHGKKEVFDQVMELPYKKVFIGDYLDSFDRDLWDHIYIINRLLEDKEDTTALIGNHERSYLYDEICSGYDPAMNDYVYTLKYQLKQILKDYVWVGDYFVSHAGVSEMLLGKENLTFDEYIERGKFNQVGYVRGGHSPCGGLYWCDWYEEFYPVKGIKQIVGHTNRRTSEDPEGIIEKDGNYNIDCLDRVPEVLLIKDNEAEILKLDG